MYRVYKYEFRISDNRWCTKRKKSWKDPGAPSTSTAKPNRFGRKTNPRVWWYQRGVVHYELLKPGETVNNKRYQQLLTELNRSLLEKRPEYRNRQHKVIFLRDNAPSHMTKLVRDTLEALGWEVLSRAAYHTWLLPISTCSHRWVTHLLSSALVWKMWKSGSMNGSLLEGNIFTNVVFKNCPKDEKNV